MILSILVKAATTRNIKVVAIFLFNQMMLIYTYSLFHHHRKILNREAEIQHQLNSVICYSNNTQHERLNMLPSDSS